MGINGLNNALTGLQIAQRNLDLVGRNIANVSTDGYTRKTMQQSPVIVGGEILGIITSGAQRYVDKALQRDYWRQHAQTSNFSTQSRFLERVQLLHGPVEANSSIASSIANLADGFNRLSASPDNPVMQRDVVNRATQMAQQFNKLSSDLLTLRQTSQDEMVLTVNNINDALDRIARLNQDIVQARGSGVSTADLEDQRDLAVRNLSEQLDVSHFTNAEGVMVVQTRSGRRLADTSVDKLQFVPTALGVGSAWPGAGAAGIFIGTLAGPDILAENPGGKLGGLATLRDRTFPQMHAQLDELAHKMALRFDAQNVRLFDDGAGNIPADAPPAYVGFAANMRVNAAVAAAPALLQSGTSGPAPGAGSNAAIMRVVRFTFGEQQNDSPATPHVAFRTTGLGPDGSVTTNLPGTTTLEKFARNLVDNHAQQHEISKSRQEFEGSLRDQLQKRLLDQSSVNLDQEVTTMMDLQKSYSASARMVTTINQLMDELMALVR